MAGLHLTCDPCSRPQTLQEWRAEEEGGCSLRRIQAPLRWGEVGSLALGVSLHHSHLQMQSGERGQSWAQVEAGGSPGQHVEEALEAQVVSDLGAGWTLHQLQTLKERNYNIISGAEYISYCFIYSF